MVEEAEMPARNTRENHFRRTRAPLPKRTKMKNPVPPPSQAPEARLAPNMTDIELYPGDLHGTKSGEKRGSPLGEKKEARPGADA